MRLITLALLAAIGFPGTALSQTNDSILDDDYIVSQEFIEGEVVQVRPQGRTITIRGAYRGDRRQFTIPENVRVTVNGREARLRDIRRGDTVLLSVVRREQRVIVDRMRVPETDVTLEERRENPIAVAETLPSSLPQTASSHPLWLVAGVLMLLASGGLIMRRRRHER